MPVPTRAATVVFSKSRFYAYTDEEAGTLATEPIEIPHVVSFNAVPTGTTINRPFSGGRGDTYTSQRGADLTLVNPGFSPAVEAGLYGHTIATAGTTPNGITTVTVNADDTPPLGEWEGLVKANNGTWVVYRLLGVRFQNAAPFQSGQEEFDSPEYTATVSGHPVSRNISVKKLYENPEDPWAE